MENERKPVKQGQYANLFSIVKQESPAAGSKPGGSIVIQIRLKDGAKERAKPVLYKKDSEFWISNG